MEVSNSEKLENYFESYRQSEELPVQLKADPHDLTKFFCAVSINMEWRKELGDEKFRRIFEHIQVCAASGELTFSCAQKVQRAIQLRDLSCLHPTTVAFRISSYQFEGSRLLWAVQSAVVRNMAFYPAFGKENNELIFDPASYPQMDRKTFSLVNKYVNFGGITLLNKSFDRLSRIYCLSDFLALKELATMCDSFLATKLQERDMQQAVGLLKHYRGLVCLKNACTKFFSERGLKWDNVDNLHIQGGVKLEDCEKKEDRGLIECLVREYPFNKIVITSFLVRHYNNNSEGSLTLWNRMRAILKKFQGIIALSLNSENEKMLKAIYPYMKIVKELSCNISTPYFYEIIKWSPNLRILKGCFSNGTLKWLTTQVPELRELHLLGNKYSDKPFTLKDLESLQDFKHLVKLKLDFKHLDGIGLRDLLKSISSLEEIILRKANISLAEYKVLFEELPNLRKLLIFDSIQRGQEIETEGVEIFEENPEYLVIIGGNEIEIEKIGRYELGSKRKRLVENEQKKENDGSPKLNKKHRPE